jgi:hypothetical protein
MAYKAAFVVMAPDGDPTKHRATIKTSKLELNVAVIELMNFEQGVKVCQDLVQKQGVQSIILCPGFSHEAVAKIAKAVGEKVAINTARGDVPSTMIAEGILSKEGWF